MSTITAAARAAPFDLERRFAHPKAFVLRVTGDSLTSEHLVDGDFVVCQPGEPAGDGRLVVSGKRLVRYAPGMAVEAVAVGVIRSI